MRRAHIFGLVLKTVTDMINHHHGRHLLEEFELRFPRVSGAETLQTDNFGDLPLFFDVLI